MSKLLTVLSYVVAFVFVFGEARSVHVLSEPTMFETHALPQDHEVVCGDGSSHSACQIVFVCRDTSLILPTALAASQYEIVHVRASNRISSPQPPPPRYVS